MEDAVLKYSLCGVDAVPSATFIQAIPSIQRSILAGLGGYASPAPNSGAGCDESAADVDAAGSSSSRRGATKRARPSTMADSDATPSVYIPAATAFRVMSSTHLKGDVFYVAASLLDPRFRFFDWIPGSTCAGISDAVYKKAKDLIRAETLKRALGKLSFSRVFFTAIN